VSRNSLLLVVPANDENDIGENGVVEEESEPVLDGHLRRLPVVETQVAVLVSLRRMIPLGWLRRWIRWLVVVILMRISEIKSKCKY